MKMKTETKIFSSAFCLEMLYVYSFLGERERERENGKVLQLRKVIEKF